MSVRIRSSPAVNRAAQEWFTGYFNTPVTLTGTFGEGAIGWRSLGTLSHAPVGGSCQVNLRRSGTQWTTRKHDSPQRKVILGLMSTPHSSFPHLQCCMRTFFFVSSRTSLGLCHWGRSVQSERLLLTPEINDEGLGHHSYSLIFPSHIMHSPLQLAYLNWLGVASYVTVPSSGEISQNKFKTGLFKLNWIIVFGSPSHKSIYIKKYW